VGWLALAYAGYIGLGVSMTIHWFSDFAAGAILGAVIGVVVGKAFGTTFIPAGIREIDRAAGG
jgi:membrane-associated phospholipid phosphatase